MVSILSISRTAPGVGTRASDAGSEDSSRRNEMPPSLDAASDVFGGVVSISSMRGRRRVVLATGGWGRVGASETNRERADRLPAASKLGDSYCRTGGEAGESCEI